MTCIVCGVEAEATVLGDRKEYACPECGHYQVSLGAAEMYRRHNWGFDVYLVRRWISDQQGSGTIPLIDTNVAARLVHV